MKFHALFLFAAVVVPVVAMGQVVNQLGPRPQNTGNSAAPGAEGQVMGGSGPALRQAGSTPQAVAPPPAPATGSPGGPGGLASVVPGYVERDGAEPSIAAPGYRISPELAKLYAQHPGESEDAYVSRMGDLYQETAAQLQQINARNSAALNSMKAQALPAAPLPQQ